MQTDVTDKLAGATSEKPCQWILPRKRLPRTAVRGTRRAGQNSLFPRRSADRSLSSRPVVRSRERLTLPLAAKIVILRTKYPTTVDGIDPPNAKPTPRRPQKRAVVHRHVCPLSNRTHRAVASMKAPART